MYVLDIRSRCRACFCINVYLNVYEGVQYKKAILILMEKDCFFVISASMLIPRVPTSIVVLIVAWAYSEIQSSISMIKVVSLKYIITGLLL